MDPLHLQLFLDTFYKKVRNESISNGKNLGKNYCYNEENNVSKINEIELKKCVIAGKELQKKTKVDMLIAKYTNNAGIPCMISIKFDDYKRFMDEVNKNIETMTPSSLSKYNIS